ncbi:MAG: hypothetical protein ACK4RG_00560 [Fimbriimonadales bacterium]
MAYSKSSGTHETGAWVYIAWLLWLAAVVGVAIQTIQGALDGLLSYLLTQGLAFAAGLLSVPLLNRVSAPNLLILVPVWLFGGWYSLMSLKLPTSWFLAPLICYASALIGGGVVVGLWERARRRKIS